MKLFYVNYLCKIYYKKNCEDNSASAFGDKSMPHKILMLIKMDNKHRVLKYPDV